MNMTNQSKMQELFNMLTSAFLLTQKISFKRQIEVMDLKWLAKDVINNNSNCFNEYEIEKAKQAIIKYSNVTNFKTIKDVKIKNVSLNEILTKYNQKNYYKQLKDNNLMQDYYFRCLNEQLSQFLTLIHYYCNAKLSIHIDENSNSYNLIVEHVLTHNNNEYFEKGYPCDLFVHDRSNWTNKGILAIKKHHCTTYKFDDIYQAKIRLNELSNFNNFNLYDCKTGRFIQC